MNTQQTIFLLLTLLAFSYQPYISSMNQMDQSEKFKNEIEPPREPALLLDLSHEQNIDETVIQQFGESHSDTKELVISDQSSNNDTIGAVRLTKELARTIINAFPHLETLTILDTNPWWLIEDAEAILEEWEQAQPGRKLSYVLKYWPQEPFVPGPESGFTAREILLRDPYAFL